MVLPGYLKTGEMVQMYECQRQSYKGTGTLAILKVYKLGNFSSQENKC